MMKTYEVLCKTCGGTGFIENINPQNTAATNTCPVCKGSKVQNVHETSNGIVQNIEIIIT